MTRTLNGNGEFRFRRPSARQVFLAGDFNGWNHAAPPMRRRPNGNGVCRPRRSAKAMTVACTAADSW